MKNLMKLAVIAVTVLLISSVGYAKCNKAADKADKECKKGAAADVNTCKAKTDKEAKKAEKECKAKEASATGEKKECFLSKLFGKKDHQQQLKELDEKSAKMKAKNDEKIASLEKELAAAKAANDTKKVEKLEKKIAKAKGQSGKDMKKIEDQKAKIKAEMANKK